MELQLCNWRVGVGLSAHPNATRHDSGLQLAPGARGFLAERVRVQEGHTGLPCALHVRVIVLQRKMTAGEPPGAHYALFRRAPPAGASRRRRLLQAQPLNARCALSNYDSGSMACALAPRLPSSSPRRTGARRLAGAPGRPASALQCAADCAAYLSMCGAAVITRCHHTHITRSRRRRRRRRKPPAAQQAVARQLRCRLASCIATLTLQPASWRPAPQSRSGSSALAPSSATPALSTARRCR